MVELPAQIFSGLSLLFFAPTLGFILYHMEMWRFNLMTLGDSQANFNICPYLLNSKSKVLSLSKVFEPIRSYNSAFASEFSPF